MARRRMSNAEIAETIVLVLILLVVGLAAGAGSFTHVHDWTMHNSPAGTGDWFGWANAIISELVPIAALLVMRQRRRTGQGISYPVFILVCALGLSIAAQLAVAKPGITGGLLSTVPALAFAGLAKLIMGKTRAPEPTPSPPAPARVTPIYPAMAAAVPVTAPAPSEHLAPVAVQTPSTPDTPAPVDAVNGTRMSIGTVTR